MIWKAIIEKAIGLDNNNPQPAPVTETPEDIAPKAEPMKVVVFEGKKYNIEQLDNETKVMIGNLQSADRCIDTYVQKAKLAKAAMALYAEQIRSHLGRINPTN